MAKLKDLKVTIGLSKRGLTKLNADLRRTKSNFKRNFGEIAGLAKNAALAIGATLGAGLTAIVKSGAELQTLEVGFRSIMGSAEGAAKMVDKLNKFTASTPFRLEEVARSGRNLLAVGVGVKDVNDKLRMLGDIAAASGNSISDISAAFAKVQAKGKVELENLNQLSDRSIPIFQELKKITGDANMEFGAGSVSVEQYNQALANMAAEGGFANGAMENLSETVSGKFSTAMDNAQQALGKFAEKSGLLDMITTSLDGMTNQIQRMSMSDDDLVKSREEVYDISVRLRDAHKGNIAALLEEAKVAHQTAAAVNEALDSASSQAHLKGALAMYTRVETAAAFASTSLPDAPAGFGEKAAPAGPPEKEVKVKKQLFEVEKSRLLQMGMAKELQGTMASDIMAAAQANHVLQGSYQEVSAAATTTLDGMVVLGNFAGSQLPGLMESAFTSIVAGAGQFKSFMLDMLEKLLIKLAAMLAAFAAMSILFPGSGLVQGGLGKFMGGQFGIQGFAAGGMVTGPTMAMVGEGPGTTLSNPEVIAPLDKLQQMMGGGAVTVTGMIRGSDILLSNERSALDRNRVRGF